VGSAVGVECEPEPLVLCGLEQMRHSESTPLVS
jgi:hypothetical protein